MEWDEDEIVVEITADVVEVEIAETATDVSIDEEKIELEIAAPEENTLEITDDLIELELIDEPEIVLEVGEGKAAWGFITGELLDQTDLQATLDGKSDTGHTHDDRYYTEQEIDAALAVINAALSGKSDVGHVHDERYYTQSEIDAALAVISAALAGKSDTGHIHDDRYYTESEIDAALAVINTALNGKSNTGHTHDDRYYTETETDTLVSGKVSKSGDTMTGDLTLINDKNLLLKPSGASSDASGDIAWYYGNGQEKMRIWGENSYSTKKGPNFRMGKKDGTQLFNGTLSLSDHTHDDRYYTESETDMKLSPIYDDIYDLQQWKSDIGHTHNSLVGSNNTGHTLGLAWSGELTTSTWFCAWGALTGYSQVVRAISAANVKKTISSALPTIKYKDVTINNFSVNANGYAAFPSASKPTAPSGYTLFFVAMKNWGRWKPDGDDRWSILYDGSYVMAGPNKTADALHTRWFYILSENIAAG